jgi:glycosyltransferase involved in cell wall biosynthesis
LQATFNSLARQNMQPAELIVIDASADEETKKVCELQLPGLQSKIIYLKASQKGAATQRNQGIEQAANPFILFCDDDILFEPFCLERLWKGINADNKAGGVNAMVTNQRYLKPGKATDFMYRLMNGERLSTYAGKCIGPAWNLLPEDDDSLPELVKVEWLNTTCTLYRREALPTPVFPNHFTGYSMMEDLTLSSIVGRKWNLYNARTARIFHDSQPGSHKNSVFELAKMELVNRQYVMKHVLHKSTFKNYLKMLCLELFFTSANAASLSGLKKLPSVIGGKISAVFAIIKS